MASFILPGLTAIFFFPDFFNPIVQIQEGFLSGERMVTRNGKEILMFRGIPYAEPPIGDLRFRNPVPKKPWYKILKAHEEGNQCIQGSDNMTGSEDCLYLNVYTPQLFRLGKPLLPVMVYVHGGGYMSGNSRRTQYGPGYLLDKDVVLVAMNYRLGIFGFLSTGDAAAPGNYGLKDQLLALQWVRRNIRAFGGDPNNVTLFGESAGGCAVSLHALSDKSKGLFKRYIMQSGTALHTFAFRSKPSYYENARKVAKKYNCTTADSSLMVDCLRQLSTFQLFDTISIFDEMSRTLQTLWGPTIEPVSEHAFMTASPVKLLQERRMKDSPIIIGGVKDEGLIFTSGLFVNDDQYEEFAKDPESTIKQALEFYEPAENKNLTDLASKMKNFYLGDVTSKEKDSVVLGYTNFLTDLSFFYPQVQLMNHMLKVNKQPFYSYSFQYRGTFSMTSIVTKNNKDHGVAHADDLTYLFPLKASNFGLPENITSSETDYEVVNIMVDLWTSFATSNIPASSHLEDSFVWKPYSSEKTFLQIGNFSAPITTLRNSFFEERMQFCYDTLPQYPLDAH